MSMANIVCTNTKGHSIAETAISQSTNKNCLIENIKAKKDFCIWYRLSFHYFIIRKDVYKKTKRFNNIKIIELTSIITI